ncbi:MAG: glycosyltransferase family 2 protein, partial [Candidatus Hodarchaeota archaeon]
MQDSRLKLYLTVMGGCHISLIKPEISVILVAKNAQNTISSVLSSLLVQTYSPKEIILVVDTWDDPTLDVASSFPITTIKNDTKGIGAARRKGVEVATGEILAFIDTDCIADEHWLKELITIFKTRKDVVVQSGRVISGKKTGIDKHQPGEHEVGKDIWTNFSETMNFA